MNKIKELILTLYYHSFIRFLFVGGVGFFVNLIIFYLLRAKIGMMPANGVAYFVAVTTTWALNRLMTFHSHDPARGKEWMRYGLVYIITGCFQMGIFKLLTLEIHTLDQHPYGALIITAGIIAFVNYTFSRKFAFRLGSA